MALLKFPLTFRITLERILVSRDIANYSVAIYSDYEQAVSRHTAISLLDIVFQNRIIGNFIISNHWFPGESICSSHACTCVVQTGTTVRILNFGKQLDHILMQVCVWHLPFFVIFC